MRNYKATDLQKKKRTLLVAVRSETSEITQLEGLVIKPNETTDAILWCGGL
jgi:hypothetical protein